MRIVRIIGLAAITAFALAAWAGAGSALAEDTTLCKTSTMSPWCRAADSYAANTVIEAGSSKVELLSTLGATQVSLTCSSSSIKGETTAKTGAPQPLKVSSWNFSGCEYSSEGKAKSCGPFLATNLPYAGSLSHTSGKNGTISLGNGGTGEPRIYISCGGLDCEFAPPSINLEGGSPAQLRVSEQKLTSKHGFACFSTVVKSMTYTVSSPSPIYAAELTPEEAHTRLCSENVALCPDAATSIPGTIVELETPQIEVFTGLGTMKCGNSKLKFETQAFGAEPLPIGADTVTLPKTCTFLGTCNMGSKTSTAHKNNIKQIPWNENAEVTLSSIWEVTCGTYSCAFGFPEVASGTLSPGALVFNRVKMERYSAACPSTVEMSSSWTVTSPKLLYPV